MWMLTLLQFVAHVKLRCGVLWGDSIVCCFFSRDPNAMGWVMDGASNPCMFSEL